MRTAYEAGESLLNEIYEEGIRGVMDSLSGIAPHIGRYIVEVYGHLFTHPLLSHRERQLITISALLALGDCPNQLQWHMNFGLRVGLTPEEIIEALTQCIPFCGFPRTLNAIQIAKRVFEANGLDVRIRDEWAQAEGRMERGRAKLMEIDGEHGEEVIRSLQDTLPALADRIVEFTFGDVYSRAALDARHRQLVTLGALTAQGGCEPQLRVHIQAALRVGLARQEVLESLMQCYPYTGFPKVLNALRVAKEEFAGPTGC